MLSVDFLTSEPAIPRQQTEINQRKGNTHENVLFCQLFAAIGFIATRGPERSPNMSPSRWRSTSTSLPPRCGPRLVVIATSANGLICPARLLRATALLGTVRSLLGGRVIEILVAETELSYGYTQPVPEEGFYNQYHGFLEARPAGANSSKLLYHPDAGCFKSMRPQAEKDADVARRRSMFRRCSRRYEGNGRVVGSRKSQYS